ncbi:DNA polymerase epsilon subunit 4-like isoform X1 [Polistes fuscatus]|uniref:DNA polymerase epsilon subunit 4-like isoform X1 n=1 Tax=Polistes fuscatus TaxID=30207 RepID=UPI001CA9E1CF|nr:DNA polymerase epsilon subunit 4-like isoform X1 [Polistes fuscatus]XP_043495181.1 DNA polymerase epsilon subunit 4-like isoform X1 [Polistes fuscatus]
MANTEVDDSTYEEESDESNIIVDLEGLQDSLEGPDTILQVDEEQREKLVRLPIGRVRNIMKMDPEVNLVNQEAVFLIAKSTELFIDSLAKEAYKYTIQTKKRTLQKRDIENAINNVDALVFLEEMLE